MLHLQTWYAMPAHQLVLRLLGPRQQGLIFSVVFTATALLPPQVFQDAGSLYLHPAGAHSTCKSVGRPQHQQPLAASGHADSLCSAGQGGEGAEQERIPVQADWYV